MKRFVGSGRAELCVEDSATSGAAVVCLHAGVCDRRMWAPQAEALGAAHRVLAYDRRGFGETRFEAEPYSRIDDLVAVLDDAGIARATLIGCSQGGRLAIDAALAHPERVGALVLVACSVSGAPEDAEGPFEPPVAALVEALEAADAGEAVEPPSAWDRLNQIRVPTLIVWGDLDFPHFGPRMREVARRIEGAQTLTMPGTAHLPNLEQPLAFNRALAGFLASIQ